VKPNGVSVWRKSSTLLTSATEKEEAVLLETLGTLFNSAINMYKKRRFGHQTDLLQACVGKIFLNFKWLPSVSDLRFSPRHGDGGRGDGTYFRSD